MKTFKKIVPTLFLGLMSIHADHAAISESTLPPSRTLASQKGSQPSLNNLPTENKLSILSILKNQSGPGRGNYARLSRRNDKELQFSQLPKLQEFTSAHLVTTKPYETAVASMNHDERQTLLHAAVIKNNPEMLAALLQKKSPSLTAAPSQIPIDVVQEAMLGGAIEGKEKQGKFAKVLYILAQRKLVDMTEKDNQGRRFLHYAAKVPGLSHKVIDYAVEAGAIADQRDHDYSTPLHVAAQRGNTSTVKSLVLDHKADIESKNLLGDNALHIAITYGHEDTVFTLARDLKADLGSNRWKPPLARAAEHGHTSIMSRFINEYNMNPNDVQHGPALHMAALRGKVETVQTLLREHKADPNLKDAYGNPLLHSAAGGSSRRSLDGMFGNDTRPELIRLIVREGKQDVEGKDESDGRTALHRAAMNGHMNSVETLVNEFGAKADAHNPGDLTPAWLAREMGEVEIAERLDEMTAQQHAAAEAAAAAPQAPHAH